VSYTSTSIAEQVRHRCRNPRCGARLRPAISHPRDAFCCRACFERFYRFRCLICEQPINRKTKRRQVCHRPKCRHEFRRHRERFFSTRYPASVLDHNGLRSADKTDPKIGTSAGRRFVQSAGSKLSATALRCASIPLDPELVARLNRGCDLWRCQVFESATKNSKAQRALRLHFSRAALGGYRFPGAPAVDLPPLPSVEWAVPSRWKPSPTAVDCPDIPEFLLRRLHVPPPPPPRKGDDQLSDGHPIHGPRAAQAAAGDVIGHQHDSVDRSH
jgi:hypothetical protein